MNHKRIQAVSNFLAVLIVLVLGAGSIMASVKAAPLQQAVEIDFSGQELLGRPTDTSITINVVPDEEIELYYEYGTSSGVYPWQTTASSATGGQPYEVIISGLQPDTKYYYRMQYRTPGNDWVVRDEHSFYTQRAPGSTFTFTITSDSHVNILLGNGPQWQRTLLNVADDHPDFNLDLGDTFAMDNVSTVQGAEQAYLFQRPYFDLIAHSASIFLAIGNHEQEEAWHLDDTGNPATSQPVMGANARKKYFLNPVPDEFYTGNTDPYASLDGDHLREDYFAWEWGDALFIVIDPFWYTTTKPYTGNIGGGESSDPGSGDRWDWTLGQEQFNWFKQTIENSNASFKFIFAHHMVGGSQDYVREGAGPAHLFEWGGYNLDGTTWGFTSHRPEAQWGAAPVHQLMIDNGVSAFFHGHDHQYAYEVRDGIVYQELPSAGFTGNGFNLYSESDPYTIKVLPSAGHLRVTVTPEEATVDYIQSVISGGGNEQVSYSYTIEGEPGETTHDLTLAVDPLAGGTTTPSVGVHSYTEDSVVNVTATPNSGYEFGYWSGACSGEGACQVTMDGDKSVTAHFTAVTYNLTVAVDPVGGGTTTPAAGVHPYAQGTLVNVTATPNAGYAFDHWSGACSGDGACQVTMDGDKSVTAHFAEVTYDLTVAVDPVGGGTTSPSVGVHTYPEMAVVPITATPASGYTFDHWSGACSGTGDCLVEMNANKSVTAHFSLINYNLTITVDPAGSGTTNPAAGIHSYSYGTAVSITATPAAGYAFSNWSGACSGDGACQVTMDGNKSVTAHFALITYDLTMAVDPTGGGTTSPTVGAHTYAENEVVAITATAASGFTFDHWTGDVADPDAASTTVTMDADKTVTAHFTGVTYDLTMAVDPVGSGTTDPAVGVHSYAEDFVVDLTATPAAGYVFDHWIGDVADPDAASTTVTMDADQTVTAVFEAVSSTCYTLAISHTGQGSDPVADPASSTGCPVGRYLAGETIDLSGAVPDTGWRISGWTGTAQDASTLGTNSFSMPASDHEVSVIYKTACYLPAIFGIGATGE